MSSPIADDATRVPAFARDTVLHTATHGAYRIVRPLRLYVDSLGVFTRPMEDRAFLAEGLTSTGDRVVLRVFAGDGEAGTFVATAWGDRESPRVDRRSASYWVHAPLQHPGFVPAHAGTLVAQSPALQQPSDATRGRAYREAGAGPARRLARPLPFVAVDAVEGATLRTLLEAAARHRRPLGPGFAITLGLQLAEALHWLHSTRVYEGRRACDVWHGCLDTNHVFVTADGGCKLLTPVLRSQHEVSGGWLRPNALPPAYALHGQRWDALARPPHASGPRGDLYQLGLLLRATLTGRPSSSVGEGALVFDPQVPPALGECVRRLLSLESEAQSVAAAEVVATLERERAAFDGEHGEPSLAAVVAALGKGHARNAVLTWEEAEAVALAALDAAGVPADAAWESQRLAATRSVYDTANRTEGAPTLALAAVPADGSHDRVVLSWTETS